MSSDAQLAKLDAALERFNNKFGFYPFFDGLDESLMYEDRFIKKLDNAIDKNDPDIDLSDYFPDGVNL